MSGRSAASAYSVRQGVNAQRVCPVNIFQLFGFAAFWAGGWCTWKSLMARRRRMALLRNAVHYSGKIVRLEDISSEGDIGPTMYVPVVKYTVGGKDYEARLNATSDTDAFHVGKKAGIIFERGNPTNVTDQNCRTWDVNAKITLSLMLLLFGAVLTFGRYELVEE